MGKSKKYIILPLVLAVLLLALVPGCKEKETTAPATTPPAATSELSQEQMQQVLADMITATQNVRTYKCEMDMTMAMETSGGSEAKNMNMDMTASGAYDQENKNMQMNMDIHIKSPDIEEGEQNMSMEMYMLEENIYMKMDMPVIGEHWVKMPASDKSMAAYNSDMVGELFKMLEPPVAIKFLKYETVDGADCYVFQVTPDMMKILQWLGKQQTTGTGFDPEKIQNAADTLKNISFKIWIGWDSGLMSKMEGSLLIDLNAEEYGAANGDFDNMNINMDMGMRLYDYDKPVTIVLPDEAKDAIDMSQMGGFGK